MFNSRYFASAYFAPRYFCNRGLDVALPAFEASGPLRRESELVRIDVLARGQVLTVRCSLLPGTAIGSAKAFGDLIVAINAAAAGDLIDVRQQWNLIAGMARSEIILTEDEEIMLILAEAA